MPQQILVLYKALWKVSLIKRIFFNIIPCDFFCWGKNKNQFCLTQSKARKCLKHACKFVSFPLQKYELLDSWREQFWHIWPIKLSKCRWLELIKILRTKTVVIPGGLGISVLGEMQLAVVAVSDHIRFVVMLRMISMMLITKKSGLTNWPRAQCVNHCYSFTLKASEVISV